jgi:hypothetical protein
MLPTILMPFLPVAWALFASAYWWRRLSSPWLFLTTALLALFGIQAVVAFIWEYWPLMSGGYFLEHNNFVPGQLPSESEMQRRLEEENRVAIIQAVVLVIAAVPFLWWLRRGLAPR